MKNDPWSKILILFKVVRWMRLVSKSHDEGVEISMQKKSCFFQETAIAFGYLGGVHRMSMTVSFFTTLFARDF